MQLVSDAESPHVQLCVVQSVCLSSTPASRLRTPRWHRLRVALIHGGAAPTVVSSTKAMMLSDLGLEAGLELASNWTSLAVSG